MKHRLLTYFILSLLFQQLAAAELNVLVLGSTTDSSVLASGATARLPFDSEKVVTEFTHILRGSGMGAVNVVYEDFHGSEGSFKHTNLFSWFHFPYPENVTSTVRWPNLRGELGTKWHYVVLIGDAHTMEYLPGFYALGVSEVSKEVAKGSAKTVLLMPWPASGSPSSVGHYKELVYRVGRSGSYAVAPAGLVWGNSGEQPSSDKSAYLAAATLYSRLADKSAAVSSYSVDDKLADLAYETVKANKGAVQYSGRFSAPHPHSAQFNTSRKVEYTFTGTSTERSHMERLRTVMDECFVEHSDHLSNRYDTNDPGSEKGGWPTGVKIPIDFNIGKFGFGNAGDQYNVNPDYWKRAYTFQYQGLLKTPEQAAAEIANHDMNTGVKAYKEAPHLGASAPRSTWAMLHRLKPNIKMNGSGNHLSAMAILPNAAFIYTCDSGRCPLTPQVVEPTDQWDALRVGYEAGWIMSNLQTRAPGFRVLPSAADKHEINNYSADGAEKMTVQFIFKPEAEVKVHLSSSHPELIKISPSVLTFTAENHDMTQSYSVVIADGAPLTTEDITVNVKTTSEDEVYNGLSDSWVYTVKSLSASSLPVATKDNYRVSVNGELKISEDQGLLANDVTNSRSPINQITVGGNVSHGKLSIRDDGSFTYRPHQDFQGRDSFTYSVSNANGASEEVAVSVGVSDLDSSLILWYDFEAVNGDVIKDSTAYGRDGVMTKPTPQVEGVADGRSGANLTKGSIDIPIDEEFYELLDSELAISFWSYINPKDSGKISDTLINGTKTYGEHTYNSLNIKFVSDMKEGKSTIYWGNGVYSQKENKPTNYKIFSSQKHSMEKFPLTPDTINDQWVHWAFMSNRDKSMFTVYKNGTLAFKGGLAGALAFGLIDEIDNLTLGPAFNGNIDDFRMYNRELSVPEIHEIMTESAPSLAKKLISKGKKK